MAELQNYVASNVDFPVHIIHVGQAAGPNTVDIENPDNPGTCLTDGQFRSREWDDPYGFVRGYADDAPEGIPQPDNVELDNDTAANAYYDKSAAQPFREAASDLYKIAVMTKGIYAPIRPVDPVSTCVDGRLPCMPGQMQVYDPYCRSQLEQVEEAMEKIVGFNPYIVVEVE